MGLDVVFEDARIVDGTGAPWFRGSVGVRDGRIEVVQRGTDPGLPSDHTIDVGGRIVCPGFIDVHSHADLELFSDPTLSPKTTQGVTTEVVGQDGLSMAPMHVEGGAERWETYLSGLNGRTDDEWMWGSTTAYLDAIDDAGVAPNVAMLVGHGTVRFNVMGMDARAPTAGELEEMAGLVTEALDQGAVGFSTGLEYSPQRHADTDEIRTLAAELEPYGRPFVAHIRSYRETMWEALDEFVDVGAETGVPVHLSHFKLGGSKTGLPDRARALARAARERGIDFTADLYPYAPGSTTLVAMLPAWVHAEGIENIPDILADEASREAIRQEIDAASDSWSFDWDSLVISGIQSGDTNLLGHSIAEAASARDQHPVDFVCELLLVEDLEVTMVAMPTSDRSETDVREIITDDLVAVGSDGIFGDRPHPRVYGTYPRLFGQFVREEKLLTIEDAIRKATSLPARIVGLQGKGLVREGMDADLVVLDPVTVHSPATFEDPRQPARGIEHVVVGGTFVVLDGAVTGETPGETIRA